MMPTACRWVHNSLSIIQINLINFLGLIFLLLERWCHLKLDYCDLLAEIGLIIIPAVELDLNFGSSTISSSDNPCHEEHDYNQDLPPGCL